MNGIQLYQKADGNVFALTENDGNIRCVDTLLCYITPHRFVVIVGEIEPTSLLEMPAFGGKECTMKLQM